MHVGRCMWEDIVGMIHLSFLKMEPERSLAGSHVFQGGRCRVV